MAERAVRLVGMGGVRMLRCNRQVAFRQLLQSPLCLALALILTTRLIGLGLAWLLWQLGLVPARVTSPDQVYLDVEPVTGPWVGWVLGVWQRLDAIYYLQIAVHGYSADNGTVVFPPLYPMLIRITGLATGGQYLLGALLISSVACIGLLVMLQEITAEEFDADSARRAVVYQMIFPTSYILIAAYAESVMLCWVLLAFRSARGGRWWLAGIAACLATLARLQAATLVLPLAYVYVRHFGLTWRAVRPQILAVIAAPVAVVAYNLYLAWCGLPSVQAEFASHWYSSPAIPGTDLLVALHLLFAGEANFQRMLSFGLLILFIVLTGMAFRRLPLEYGLYMAAMLLYTLSRHDLGRRALLSVSRHVLVLFPGFMLMGMAGRNRWVHRLIVYPSVGLYLFLMGVFFMWGYAE